MNKAALHDDTVATQNDNLRVAVDERDFCHRLHGDAATWKLQDTAVHRSIDLSRFFRKALALECN